MGQLVSAARRCHLNAMPLPRTWSMFGKAHLPYRLLLLARMIDRGASKDLPSTFGITLAEWRVLAFIGASGPASASDICKHAQVDRAEVSRAVRKLEQSGRVTREADGPLSKRYTITLTEDGQALFRSIRDRRRRYFDAIMRGLDEPAREQLESSLEIIASNIADLPDEY